MDAAPAVLVVEAHEPTRALLRALLESEGYRVEVAATACDGMRCFDRSDFDLVLLDQQWSDFRAGATFCREVRRRDPERGGSERTSHLPILVLTA